MKTVQPDQAGNLEFLQPYKVESEAVSLSSDEQISIQKYFLRFDAWKGKPPEFDFGRKPLIDTDGEACFAELSILRLFLKHGWEGAWVETYGGTHFLHTMPQSWSLKSEHISIPPEKENLLKEIWKAGGTRACFDVVVWKGDKLLFCEAKRHKKDQLNDAQKKFIQGALLCGIPLPSFLIIEWDLL